MFEEDRGWDSRGLECIDDSKEGVERFMIHHEYGMELSVQSRAVIAGIMSAFMRITESRASDRRSLQQPLIAFKKNDIGNFGMDVPRGCQLL